MTHVVIHGFQLSITNLYELIWLKTSGSHSSKYGNFNVCQVAAAIWICVCCINVHTCCSIKQQRASNNRALPSFMNMTRGGQEHQITEHKCEYFIIYLDISFSILIPSHLCSKPIKRCVYSFFLGGGGVAAAGNIWTNTCSNLKLSTGTMKVASIVSSRLPLEW